MNTTSVLALYQMELIEVLSAAPAQEVVKELRKVSEVLVHLARGAAHSSGRSIASLWMARRHLWLAQSKLPEPDRNTLMKQLKCSAELRSPGSPRNSGSSCCLDPHRQSAHDPGWVMRALMRVATRCLFQRAGPMLGSMYRNVLHTPPQL